MVKKQTTKQKTYKSSQYSDHDACDIIKLHDWESLSLYLKMPKEFDMNKDNDKAPVWFQSFEKNFNELITEFNKFKIKQETFNDEVRNNFKVLFSLPTIEKELKNSKNKIII